ncbi:MAG TPA: response regulator [Cytophagales bacterium]|nr:response regulator [Cytophagales bacterium]
MKHCKSVILIDDDPIENLVNKKLIEDLSLTESIKIMFNGYEGMNYLRILNQLDLPPDIIFLDLNMPIMDGFEFLTKFHKLPFEFTKDIKVIVLTSSVSERDYNKAKLIGCDGYLIKPLTKKKIKEECKKVLAL